MSNNQEIKALLLLQDFFYQLYPELQEKYCIRKKQVISIRTSIIATDLFAIKARFALAANFRFAEN